jgi:DNA-binding response OmpR family regulator
MSHGNPSSAPRVLLADASAVMRAEMAKVFAGDGVAVAQCAAAGDVLPFAREHGADVVVLDAAMPLLHVDACLRDLDAPVILTCPRDIDESRLTELEASGALLVLVKPLTRDGLLHAFRQALAESGQRNAKPGARRRHAA